MFVISVLFKIMKIESYIIINVKLLVILKVLLVGPEMAALVFTAVEEIYSLIIYCFENSRSSKPSSRTKRDWRSPGTEQDVEARGGALRG